MGHATENNCPLILVADDEEDILLLIRMVLEEEGYEVATAPDGAQALRLANQRRPDLCVLDVMMPEVDGYDVARVLKRDEELREIPVILLTARTEPENVARGREAGADEYIAKPFVLEEFQEAVRALLSARPSGNGTAAKPEPELDLDLQPEPEPRGGAGRFVLLAGRDHNLLDVARYRLELGGYEVAVAESAEQGLEMASELVPDAFVLDASQPQVDAEAVARLLSAKQQTKAIKLVTLANGAPFDPQELFVRVEAALGTAARG